jgi:haloalkane dehalogenase
MNSVDVLGSAMAYAEAGAGPTAVFLHGNPTSSYVSRNILPHVARVARCVAPDLIGFGRSGKPDIEYSFFDHVRYLDAFLETLHVDKLYFVAQDWGTALAFHYAARFPERILGLAFMEFIHPMPSWDAFHSQPKARELFQAFRTPGVGEKLILEENVFLERVLPGSVVRQLTEDERNAYRAPFPTPASRKPILEFPRQLPIAGEPREIYDVIEKDDAKLVSSEYPKLLFSGNPGALISPAFASAFASQLRQCKLVQLGAGAHYLQEDHPERIGTEIARWIGSLS